MAKPNISLWGATYSGAAGVTLPKSGGGTATFPWVEGSETKTQNGTYDVTNLAELVVNVSGGGGGATDTVTTLPSGGDYHAIVGTPISGTLNINSNGTYNVSSYASAEVFVSGGGAVAECPITISLSTASDNGYGQYAIIACQMTSGVDYLGYTTLYNHGTSSPVSCYATPRRDTSQTYPYEILIVSTYGYRRPDLNASSTKCTVLNQDYDGKYYLCVGVQSGANVLIDMTNMN